LSPVYLSRVWYTIRFLWCTAFSLKHMKISWQKYIPKLRYLHANALLVEMSFQKVRVPFRSLMNRISVDIPKKIRVLVGSIVSELSFSLTNAERDVSASCTCVTFTSHPLIQRMYEGCTGSNEHIYPTLKRRYTYKNKWC
jgi:hypothetical protein